MSCICYLRPIRQKPLIVFVVYGSLDFLALNHRIRTLLHFMDPGSDPTPFVPPIHPTQPAFHRHAAANLLLKRRPSMNLGGSTGPSPVPLRAFKPNAFPGSRPMHLERRASALSSEARPQETNYRGFFHLGTMTVLLC